MGLTVHKPDQDAFVKALIFGPHGNGKTRFLGTADDDERTAPMLLLNFEGGTRTLAGRDTDIVDIRGWQDYNEAYAYLTSDACTHKSVGLDSISETQVSGLLSILDAPAISRGGRPSPDTLEQADWGAILVQMRRLVRHYKFLPMHVFMTALATDGSIPRIGTVRLPSVQGQFVNDLPGIVDVVGYMAVEDVEADDDHPDGTQRLLLLRNYPKFSVKARVPWDMEVPNDIVDPTVSKLLDALGY